jgi:hypothetical protein
MDTPLRKAMRDAGMKESDFRWRELIMRYEPRCKHKNGYDCEICDKSYED